jgi:hypothetical protein
MVMPPLKVIFKVDPGDLPKLLSTFDQALLESVLGFMGRLCPQIN